MLSFVISNESTSTPNRTIVVLHQRGCSTSSRPAQGWYSLLDSTRGRLCVPYTTFPPSSSILHLEDAFQPALAPGELPRAIRRAHLLLVPAAATGTSSRHPSSPTFAGYDFECGFYGADKLFVAGRTGQHEGRAWIWGFKLVLRASKGRGRLRWQ